MISTLSEIDDLEKKWPKEELLSALGFPVRVRNVLIDRHWEEKDAVSLKDVMEVVISSDEDPRPGYIISRLLGLRNVGRKGYWLTVEQLNKIDLGKKCNSFWKLKYEKLMRAYRVKGEQATIWSIPVSDAGKGYVIWKNKKGLTPHEKPRSD